jgi:hypothetical protein
MSAGFSCLSRLIAGDGPWQQLLSFQQGVSLHFFKPQEVALHERSTGFGKLVTFFLAATLGNEFNSEDFFGLLDLAPRRPVGHAELFRSPSERAVFLNFRKQYGSSEAEVQTLLGLKPEVHPHGWDLFSHRLASINAPKVNLSFCETIMLDMT